MRRDWIINSLVPIIFLIALFYVMLVGTFFAYVTKQQQDKRLHERLIETCVGSGGHIGPGFSCWRDEPIPTGKPRGPLN